MEDSPWRRESGCNRWGGSAPLHTSITITRWTQELEDAVMPTHSLTVHTKVQLLSLPLYNTERGQDGQVAPGVTPITEALYPVREG